MKQRLIDQLIDAVGGEWPSNDFRCRAQKTLITRDEFEARVAERQNKPSWDDATEWARYLAQDSGGRWYWYDAKPVAFDEEFGVEAEVGKAFYSSRYGEVIGDWRSTPEQRPNHIGESDEKGALNFDLEMDIAKSSPVLALHLAKEKLEAYQDGRCKQLKWQELCHRNESKHASYIQANVVEPWLKTPMTAEAKPGIDFEWLANQFDDADDINAVWALRDKLHHKNKPETSPELSFHLANAFNELQASARLLPEDDPRRAQLVALAGGVSAVKEVA